MNTTTALKDEGQAVWWLGAAFLWSLIILLTWPITPAGAAPLPQLSPNEKTIVRKTYLLETIPVALRTVVSDQSGRSETLHYLFTDHLGSVTALVDDSGAIIEHPRFAPFGEPLTPLSDITSRGYTGHRHDPELGLIYMNARWYDPVVGRFLAADAIIPDPLNPQSINRYSYVLNNPLRWNDPSGHCKNAGLDPNGNVQYECRADDGTVHFTDSSSHLYKKWYGQMEMMWDYLSNEAEGSFDDFVAWALDGGLFFIPVSSKDLSNSSGGNNSMGFSPLFLGDNKGNPEYAAYRNGEAVYHAWSIGKIGLKNHPGYSLILPLADLSASQKETLLNFMYNAVMMDAVWGNSGVRVNEKDVSSGIKALGKLADQFSISPRVDLGVSVANVLPSYFSNLKQAKQRTFIASVQLHNSRDGLQSSGFSMNQYHVAWATDGFKPYTNTNR